MSNYQDSSTHQELAKGEKFSDRQVPTEIKLHICLFSEEKKIVDEVKDLLAENTYKLTVIDCSDSLVTLTKDKNAKIDCLVLSDTSTSRELLFELQKIGILLPVAIVYKSDRLVSDGILYHPAEIKFSFSRIDRLSDYINRALTEFLHLTPQHTLQTISTKTARKPTSETSDSLSLQQRRLTEKLKERLGYLGVYYKRNSQDFYRNLSETEQKKLYQQLSKEYRQIILEYFEDESNLNQTIDSFVNLAFFSDISIATILEIHMSLMDEFSQQLKIEGRKEDILLDYRLALIDIIAHLCEMYRRSIPRDDTPIDVLFKLDRS